MMQWGTRMAHGAQGRAGWMCARALAAACRAGGRGRTLGTGLDGHLSPSNLHGGQLRRARARRVVAQLQGASQLPSERRPRALPPTAAKSSLAM